MSKQIVADGQSIKFQIWDTAGQEVRHAVTVLVAPLAARSRAATLARRD